MLVQRRYQELFPAEKGSVNAHKEMIARMHLADTNMTLAISQARLIERAEDGDFVKGMANVAMTLRCLIHEANKRFEKQIKV